jgi:hypothetical protein
MNHTFLDFDINTYFDLNKYVFINILTCYLKMLIRCYLDVFSMNYKALKKIKFEQYKDLIYFQSGLTLCNKIEKNT